MFEAPTMPVNDNRSALAASVTGRGTPFAGSRFAP
jgi:hypothetical protein